MIELYSEFFATLKPDFKDKEFNDVFAPNALFEDPFQKVYGTEAIITVFRHMYATLYAPKFIVIESMGNHKSGYIRWKFLYSRNPNSPQECIKGLSHVLFDNKGLVLSHIDYWDAAANVYEKIPLLGWILRLLKNKIKAL